MSLLSLPRKVAQIWWRSARTLLYRRLGVSSLENLMEHSIYRVHANRKSAIRRIVTLRWVAKLWGHSSFRPALVCLPLVLGVAGPVLGQSAYLPNGAEYAIAGTVPGDQVRPHAALNAQGGFVVWEDNLTSPSGLGVSALRLDSSFSGALSSFKVNASNTGDAEHAQVAMFRDGGAVFAWQGGRLGFQHIYARFLSASNTWVTGDIQVNGSTNYFQMNPAVATLQGGNVVVVWSSINQRSSSSMQDVYGQVFSPTGQKIGGEFLVNQFTLYNQRTPSIAALSSGGFVVAWVSEQQRTVGAPAAQLALASQLPHASVDIYARQFSATAQPVNNEFVVNTGSSVCANPSVAAGNVDGFIVGWGEKDTQVPSNSWDVFARVFSGAGVGAAVSRVNTETYGDQFAPRLSSAGGDYLMVWTSLGQDNSMEGVFGQFLKGDGSAQGTEFRVNTVWVSKQMHPTVASDGSGRFLVTWTSFGGGPSSFDLCAQRYVNPAISLAAMAAPYAYVPFVVSNGVYQPQIVVSWPVQSGLAGNHFELYVDGVLTASPGTNIWTMTAANGLTVSSTHSFQVAAVGADGRRTPLSPATSVTTWGGYNWAGIPFEWMAGFYGMDSSAWPAANLSLGQGAPTLYQVFLTGGNPLQPSTWLRTSIEVQSSSKGKPFTCCIGMLSLA